MHFVLDGGRTVGLLQFLNEARFSADSALQSVALIHRVKRAEHDMKDREILIGLSRWDSLNSWYWREDRIRALILGWPGDLEVKREAMQSVSEQYRNRQILDSDGAGILLLEGFPQDDEVAECIANLFRTRDHPGVHLGLHGTWERLTKAFAGHQILVPEVDAWLGRAIERNEKKAHELFWDSELCLISRSKFAKGILLTANDETGVITEYQAVSLLQGWGMQDKEAAAALRKLADSAVAKHVAHLLPSILHDKKLCRQRLIEILHKESEFIARRALIGLAKLGVNECDGEVVEAVVGKYTDEVPSGAAFLGLSNLIEHFPNHTKVREVALYQLQHRGGDLNTVARVYGSNDGIRCELVKLCYPLPAHLRLIVVDRLGRLAPEDDFAHCLLSNFDEDIDVNVKTAAAIGYVKSVKLREEVSPHLLNKLEQGLHALGPDLGERRQAAFSALLELDRLDIVKTAWSKDERNNIGFGGALKTNLRLAEHLGHRWNGVSKAFGESFWERVDWVPEDFLTEMAARTTDPDLLDKIVDKLRESPPERWTAASLQILARQWRGTPRLRELCLNLIRDFRVYSWVDTAPGIVAAEILVEQFVNDSNAFALLESLVTQGKISSALVIALGAGWPDSQAWKQLSKQDRMPTLLLPAQFHLLAASAPPREFVTKVGTTMANLCGDIWEFLPSFSRAVNARFARDKQVREFAFSRLEANPTSSEKMNLPFFLLGTGEDLVRLRTWIRAEIKRQFEGKCLTEVALDLSTGTTRSVSHVLLEHLLV